MGGYSAEHDGSPGNPSLDKYAGTHLSSPTPKPERKKHARTPQAVEQTKLQQELEARPKGQAQKLHSQSSRRNPALMTCTYPLPAVQNDEGRIVLGRQRQDAAPVEQHLHLPCGECFGCRMDRSRSWAIRMAHELETQGSASFLTLTYSDEHLPAHGALRKRDLDLFFKRLRNRIGPFRYFACGEYGDKFGRPHYHMVLYGHDLRFTKQSYEIRGLEAKSGQKLYGHHAVDDAWGLGNVRIGGVTEASIAYVAGYVVKKAAKEARYLREDLEDPETGELVDGNEFLLMSRRPGIGSDWYEKHKRELLRGDGTIAWAGNRCRLPDYYLSRLREDAPEWSAEASAKRQHFVDKTQNIPFHERVERERVRMARASTGKTRHSQEARKRAYALKERQRHQWRSQQPK